jgi:CheY-like chemotaxis protein
VSSRPDEGSRFKARLMLSDLPETGAALVAGPVSGHAGIVRRILVADDDAGHRALMTDLLTPLGFDLRTAADGRECLALVPSFRPDLFLLDLSMPGMDGRELALLLRETEGGQAPIIFVSGEVLRGEAHGFDLKSDPGLAGCAVLPKPVDLAVLLREIGTRLDLTWVRPDDVEAAPEPAAGDTARQIVGSGTRALSAGQISVLRTLAENGSLRGLREHMDALEREAPELEEALRPLRAHVSAYQLEALQSALEAMDVPA